MKFTCSIVINQSRAKIVEFFSKTEYQHHFQDGFISKTLLSGTEGENGSTSKMVYKRLELIETVLENNLPDSFYALYEHKHTTNTMRITFTELNENSTQYDSEIHYTKFNGFIINALVKLFPGMFKKQVLKWMKQFKEFAENN